MGLVGMSVYAQKGTFNSGNKDYLKIKNIKLQFRYLLSPQQHWQRFRKWILQIFWFLVRLQLLMYQFWQTHMEKNEQDLNLTINN